MTHDQIRLELKTDRSRKLFEAAVLAGYVFRAQNFYGAFKRGYVAVVDGKSKRTCPYKDHRQRYQNCKTFSTAFRRYWLDGYDFALHSNRPDIWPKEKQRSKTNWTKQSLHKMNSKKKR